MIKLTPLQFLKEKDRYRNTEEIVGQQKDYGDKTVYKVYMEHPCIEKSQDIRKSPHKNTQGQKKRTYKESH